MSSTPKTDPLRFSEWASAYLADHMVNGVPTVHYFQGAFWLWSARHPCYVRHEPRLFKTQLLNWLREEGITSDSDIATKVMDCLSGMTSLPTGTVMPSWLGAAAGRTAPTHVALLNGLVDPVSAAQTGRACRQDHTPNWFSPVLLPYRYDGSASCPLWESWLAEMLPDKQSILLLQELFGYWITSDTSRQVAAVLCGPEGTGKSTVAEVASQIVGKSNCSFLSLDKFGSHFGLSATIGKTLNIADEVGQVGLAAESMLKWYIGGLETTMDIKYMAPVTVRPTARLLFSTNDWPKFHDQSGGIWRRLLIIPMEHRIPREKFDVELPTKLSNELPGIFNWAVAGLKRLLESGFTRSQYCEDAAAHHRNASQPYLLFVEDCIQKDKEGFVSNQYLQDQYEQWCVENGYPHTGGLSSILSTVTQRIGPVTKGRAQQNGRQVRGVFGIKLRRPE